MHVVKDRLYCGSDLDSKIVQSTLNAICRVICKALWPITPFLIEELWSQHSREPFFKHNYEIPENWHEPELEVAFEAILDVRQNVNNVIRLAQCNSWMLNLVISGNVDLLRKLSQDELCELFQVQSVELKTNAGSWQIEESKRDELLCPRCRRFSVSVVGQVCGRCQKVLIEKGCHK